MFSKFEFRDINLKISGHELDHTLIAHKCLFSSLRLCLTYLWSVFYCPAGTRRKIVAWCQIWNERQPDADINLFYNVGLSFVFKFRIIHKVAN